MNNQKKLQVFVSSTYLDLLEERQAAVEAILKAGHIPAGMELFTSSNKSQWEIIKRWIDESDIYMLILGGRYGSIEEESGKSYTHLEYEYAQSKGKPLFAVVIEESALECRQANQIEKKNPQKLEEFRQTVLSYMSSFFTEPKDIKLAVHESLGQIVQDYDLTGWVRGDQQNDKLADEMVFLNNENRVLRLENEKLKSQQATREPELEVILNKNMPFHFQYTDDNSQAYKERQSINTIPSHLQTYISFEDVDEFNASLRNITEDNVELFNSINIKKLALKNLQHSFELNVRNIGNLKANNIFISVAFPDFVWVFDGLREVSKLIEKLDKEALEIIPNPKYDPLIDAEEKYRNRLKYGSLAAFMNQKNHIKPLSSIGSNLVKQPDFGESNKVKNNVITIKLNDLLHGLDRVFDKYILVPIEKGSGLIAIEIHCEEYLEKLTTEIPITVE